MDIFLGVFSTGASPGTRRSCRVTSEAARTRVTAKSWGRKREGTVRMVSATDIQIEGKYTTGSVSGRKKKLILSS